MVKINTLFSLSEISDCYSITKDCKIINTVTNYEKTFSLGKRGYYYVTLNNKFNKQIKVYVHKIIALAFIKNEEYQVINHINGNKLDNSITNLEFCSQKDNVNHAWESGLIIRKEREFTITKIDGSIISGTVKELSKILKIPKGTLYDLYYKSKSSNKYSIKTIK